MADAIPDWLPESGRVGNQLDNLPTRSEQLVGQSAFGGFP